MFASATQAGECLRKSFRGNSHSSLPVIGFSVMVHMPSRGILDKGLGFRVWI